MPTISQQRYLSRFVGIEGTTPIYAAQCGAVFGSGRGASLNGKRYPAKFIGIEGSTPIYAMADCDFPNFGRYVMKFIGIEDGPVYGVSCCSEPVDCEAACIAEGPLETATLTTPANGDIVFTFPVVAEFDCTVYAESTCDIDAWVVLREQECETGFPATDPTASLTIGGSPGPSAGCYCTEAYGVVTGPFPVKNWYRQYSYANRVKQWMHLGYKWYVVTHALGTTGDVRITVTLELRTLLVIGYSAAVRSRMKSVTSECSGGLQVITAIDASWTTSIDVIPLPSPPFCVANIAGSTCLSEFTTAFTGTCDTYSYNVGISGNQNCGTIAYNYRAIVTANCNSTDSGLPLYGYPYFDQTDCYFAPLRDPIRAYNKTGPGGYPGDNSGRFVWEWEAVVPCADLRAGPITLNTKRSPPSGDFVITGSDLITTYFPGTMFGLACVHSDSTTPQTPQKIM